MNPNDNGSDLRQGDMTEGARTSVLSDRHRALGSELGDWNGMGVAWSYTASAEDERDAVRTAAGLFDVSGLRKVWVRGPDALDVVDHVITRNMKTSRQAGLPTDRTSPRMVESATTPSSSTWVMTFGWASTDPASTTNDSRSQRRARTSRSNLTMTFTTSLSKARKRRRC